MSVYSKMILPLFIFFNALSLIVIFLGFVMRADALKFLGFTLLTLFGFVILFGDLQVYGSTTIVTAGNTTTVTDNYVPYAISIVGPVNSGHLVGIFYIMATILGFLLTMFERRDERQ